MTVAILFIGSSFTTELKTNSVEQPSFGEYKWFNFNGTNLLEMLDPSYYSPDENNFPDCTPGVGLVYCEVYARATEWGGDEPDLLSIMNCRMKSLL